MAETTHDEAVFTLDGEPLEDIREFVRDNGLDEAEEAAVYALRPGDEMRFGGGAAAEFVLRREA